MLDYQIVNLKSVNLIFIAMVSKIIIIKLFVYFGNEIDLYLQAYLMYINIATTQGAVDELLVQHSVG